MRGSIALGDRDARLSSIGLIRSTAYHLGMEVTFRARGWARAGFALFLGLWLVGWAVGEWFVVRAIVWSLQGGWESPAARAVAHPVGWLVAGFVLAWTALWTAGGAGVVIELLRLMAGVDHLRVSPDGWTIRRRIGPLQRTRFVPRSEFRDVFLTRGGGALMIESTSGDLHVTSYGSVAERRAIADRFANPTALDELPRGWTARPVPGGTTVARESIDSPGCLAAVGAVALLAAVFAVSFRGELARWGIVIAAAVSALFGALFLWGAFSRREWLVRPGAVSTVVRFAAWRWETALDPESVAIEVQTDSDGDESVTLRGTSRGKNVVLLRTIGDARAIIRLARRIETVSGWRIPLPHVLYREARKTSGS